MKPMFIIFLLLACALWIDLKPSSIEDIADGRIRVMVRDDEGEDRMVETDLYATVGEVLAGQDLPDDADLSALNPQTVLKDGDVITVRRSTPEEKAALISINTADVSQLMMLPGIGKSTAEKIIAYREENGLFQTAEDLMRVKGIGEAKYEKLKDLICL